MSCQVCIEPFNKSNRTHVSCCYCSYEVCRTCTQTYLVSIATDPHCMNCKRVWNREFIDLSCTKTFRNKELKIHRENILFNREKNLLPETQPLVVQRKKIKEYDNKLAEIEITLARLRTQAIHIQEKKAMVYRNKTDIITERKKFVHKCPVEGCKGFLSTRWKCDLCDNIICQDCNEIKTEEHQCDPGGVETMKLIKKDTKPCPSCGTVIFKISGCDQMWCIECKSAFSWITGRLEMGVVHNPHYYDFMRNNGGLPPNGCNEDEPPPIRVLCRILPQDTTILNIHRLIYHIRNVTLRKITENPMVTELKARELRINYMMDVISEDSFKINIQRREKASERKRDIHNILTMFTNTISGILKQLVDDRDVSKYNVSIENLKSYTNNTLLMIQRRYECKIPIISTNWLID